MLLFRKGELEWEIVFWQCQRASVIKKEIQKTIRRERKTEGIQFHVTRLELEGNKILFHLKGEKVRKQTKTTIRFWKRKTSWLPSNYSLVKSIPKEANLYEELEETHKLLERRFGRKYEVTVLLPVIETEKSEILVVLLGKLIK